MTLINMKRDSKAQQSTVSSTKIKTILTMHLIDNGVHNKTEQMCGQKIF